MDVERDAMPVREREKQPFIELLGISKQFGVTKALQDVNLKLFPGETIGLIGPNGAGKSTLIKIITGVYTPTSGTINIEGETIKNYGTRYSIEHGVSCAYQELSLCSNLKVYENIELTHMDHSIFGKRGWRKEARKYTKELLEQFFPGNGINVSAVMGELPLPQRQMVEIVRAMTIDGLKVLILDEPTSALTSDRIHQLHTAIKALQDKGVCIIYISHKLDEITRISNRIVILVNGCSTVECSATEVTNDDIVRHMGGQVNIHTPVERDEAIENAEDAATVKKLSTDTLSDVSLTLKKGELLGISGLVGSGQKDLLIELFNKSKGHKRSEIEINGRVAYISGDRQVEGVFNLWSIAENILISSINLVSKWGFINREKANSLAQHWYDKLKFKANGLQDEITSLSGGNQQKALIARGIASDADIILLNDPTAGVDVETKQEIYRLLKEVKQAGKSVILYSTEDIEMEQCDRVYIMYKGTIVEELKGNDITTGNIVAASFNHQVETEEVVSETGGKEGSLIHSITANRTFLPVVTLIAIFIFNIFLNRGVASYIGIRMLLGTALPLIFVSLGQMFIVVAGDIDLSNGTATSLINCIVVVILMQNPFMGILACVGFVVLYTLMGVIVHVRRVPAIVVTLSFQFIFLGLALLLAPDPVGGAPVWLTGFYRFPFPVIPMVAVLAIIISIITFWILKRSKYGMIIRGIGNNPNAIIRAGWSHFIARLVIYFIAAIMIVCAGFAFTAVSSGCDANGATTYQMLSIAAIMLGGCAFSGGIGEPIGVVAGAFTFSLITTMLAFLKINNNLQLGITGAILILTLTIRLFSGKKVRSL